MRVLVTGGAGFVGRHLVRSLLARDDEVVVLDDGSSGALAGVPRGATLLEADVREASLVAAAVEDSDLVFHLAAAVGPQRVAEDPVDTWSRNVDGTASVVRAATAAGRRLVMTSSSEVYGRPEDPDVPLAEDAPSRVLGSGRRDVYALSKLAGEALAYAEHRMRLLPMTVVRPFNVVGPGQGDRYGMVLARFVEAALHGRDLVVFGDGRQRRCFLHVGDAVDALLRLAATPAAEGETVNLGSDEEIAVLDLAHRVLAQVGGASRIRHVPFESVHGEGFHDLRRRRPDLRRLRHLLPGWHPQRDVAHAIAHMAAGVHGEGDRTPSSALRG